MNYPANTATTLMYMGYDADVDFECLASIAGEAVTLNWFHADAKPDVSAVTSSELPAAKHFAKQAIKAEANRRILATMPDWKQRNLTARSVEIVSAIVDGTATQADHDELAELKAQKADVDAVRTASDAAEAEVDALTTVADVEAYDVRGW